MNIVRLETYANTIPNSPKSRPELKVEGRRKTIKVIAFALYAMGLKRTEAVKTIYRWNDRLQWSWEDKEIERFIEYVEQHHSYTF